jgi:protoheme IX farnesyltransferase
VNSATHISQDTGTASSQDAVFGLTASALGTAEPSDYYALMKPRVMSLVVFTAMAGLICAPGSMNVFLALASIFFIAMGAGAAGALNMWYDRDIDAVMTRTKKRPLPAGKMTPDSVLAFGIIMSVISVLGLGLASNYYAAGLLAFTIFFYFVVYTLFLKRSTPQNIVIGGAAGAFPPMVGWAAAAGGVSGQPFSMDLLSAAFAPESMALFMIIFLWTPPHFWALALYKQGDYHRANIPMMPNIHGAAATRLQIMLYAVLLAAASLWSAGTGISSPLYLAAVLLLNGGFLTLAFKVWRSHAGDKTEGVSAPSLYDVKRGDKAARNLFAYSIVYLFAQFAVLIAVQFLKG